MCVKEPADGADMCIMCAMSCSLQLKGASSRGTVVSGIFLQHQQVPLLRKPALSPHWQDVYTERFPLLTSPLRPGDRCVNSLRPLYGSSFLHRYA